MNQEKIPNNNLPVYFQKYKVDILDGIDNVTKAGSVTYTTVGAIPSNVKEERVWSFILTGTNHSFQKKKACIYLGNI